MTKVIVIAGPTASGKTAFGVEVARLFDGEIISCDSMQIYKEMNIGTAKITDEETFGVRHYMIDTVDPNREFSVGEYSKTAKSLISDIADRGKIPIIVGGTGLYIDGVLYPLTFGAGKDESVRRELEKECEIFGKQHMYDMLVKIDPADASKIHPNNVKRVLRALEIYRLTGTSKSNMQSDAKQLQYDCCMVVLNPSKEILADRISRRVDQMFDNGLPQEVERLLSMGLNFSMQSMQAIGYKEFSDKNADLTEIKESIKSNSRKYAKRQITWFKRYDFAKWFDPTIQKDECIQYIERFLRG